MSTTCHFGATVAGRPMKTRGRSKSPGRSMKGPTNGEIRASDRRCTMRIPRPVRRRKGVLTSDPGTTRDRYTAAKHQIEHRAWRGVVSAHGRATEWATGRATERTSEDRRSRRRRKEQGDIWNRNTAYPSGKQATSPSTATSVIVPSRFSVPSMLYRGIGLANFLVVTWFFSTNRVCKNLVVAPLSTMATTSLCRCLPINRTGI